MKKIGEYVCYHASTNGKMPDCLKDKAVKVRYADVSGMSNALPAYEFYWGIPEHWEDTIKGYEIVEEKS